MLRIGALVTVTILSHAGAVSGQNRSTTPATSKADSAALQNLDNALAVMWSGTWRIDGEFKKSTGVYYKLTGYFAYVASTASSADDGDRAVIAMYMEPMAGGSTTWMGASLRCAYSSTSKTVNCTPTSGANELLDINIIFSDIPIRGESVEAQITEPATKTGAERFTSRSTNRGKFTLKPIGT